MLEYKEMSQLDNILILKRFIAKGATLIGTDTEPYLYRSSPSLGDYNRERDEIVGVSVGWNQLRTENNLASTIDGITTSYANGKFTITNDSRTTNYNSGSSRNTISVDLVANHKYIVFGDSTKSIVGVGVNYTDTSSNIVYAEINSVFSTSNMKPSNTTLQFRINKTYDFVSTHPIGDVTTLTLNVADLTQMFGSTIADYIYTLEQGTAGAGVSFFKRYFGADYYPFDSGSIRSVEGLVSHDMVGFNQWDEEWELGLYSDTDGAKVDNNSRIRCKDYIKCLPNAGYYYKSSITREGTLRVCYYDANKNFISSMNGANWNNAYTTPNNAHYLTFCVVGVTVSTYNNDICINISDADLNGQYKPYEKHSYPLDSDLTLRGIPKLDASNNLYYDGDTYEVDGTVTRKYGVVDLGTLTWTYNADLHLFLAPISDFKLVSNSVIANIVCSKYQSANYLDVYNNTTDKAISSRGAGTTNGVAVYDSAYTDKDTFKTAMNGVYLVYELATPTTETAQPYAKSQKVSPSGTEEYVTTSVVPVGHNTEYYG